MAQRRGLVLREKLFCRYMAELGNPKEAALRAGYPPLLAGIKAALLLERPAIRRELQKRWEQQRRADVEKLAVAGLRRLAFCQTNDAVALALTREEAARGDLSGLDLFCVAGVKAGRDGAEIKMFDRIRALETLLDWARGGESGGRENSVYAALERSAEALREAGEPASHEG